MPLTCETKNKTAPINATAENQQTHGALNQSASLPLSNTICNGISHTQSHKNPNLSRCVFFWRLAYGGSSRYFFARAIHKNPKGTFIKKIYGQDQFSVIHPPITGPKIGATTTTKPNTDIALFLASPVKLSIVIACAIGIKHPPPIPCNARAITIIPIEFETPHKNDASVKINTPIIKKFFLPKNLQKKSTIGITILLAIR